MVYCPRAKRQESLAAAAVIWEMQATALIDVGYRMVHRCTPAGRTVPGSSMDTAEGLGRMLRPLQLLPASLFHDPGC